jgi:hypothetical protein
LPGADIIPWEVEISEGSSWGEKTLVGAFSTAAVETQLQVLKESGVEGLAAYNKGSSVSEINRKAYRK